MENSSSPDFNITWRKYCTEDDRHIHVTSVLSAVICALAFLLGPIVNGFILWIKVYKMEKKYRSILYLHLFTAGFIFSLIQSLDMVYFALDVHWPFGSFLCRLNGAIFYLYVFVSSLILILFSIDYSTLVLYTFCYNYYRTTWLASMEVLVIWIFSVGISVPYFIFKNTYDCQNSTKCVYGGLHNEEVQYQSIVTTAFVLGFFILFLVIVSCLIITGMFYHWKKNSKYTTNLKLIFLNQICFALCCLPYHIFSFLSSFTNRETFPNSFIEEGLNITRALVSLPTCIIPLMYAFVCPEFKEIFFCMIRKVMSTGRNSTYRKRTVV